MQHANSKNISLIIDTAVSLFKTHGYQNVSVNKICKSANIPRSSFYTLFSGKKDIISYILSEKGLDHSTVFHDFVDLANDFERIWNLCDHYLTIVEDFGPKLTGSLLCMELEGALVIYEDIHSLDSLLVKLMKNCQKIGIIQCSTPAKNLIPITDSLVFQVVYDWCRCNGAFSLKKTARSYMETVLNVASQYRWEYKE